MRYESKVSTVTSLDEDGHDHDEANQGTNITTIGFRRVDLSNDNKKSSSQHTASDDPGLLEPEVASALVVDDVGNDSTKRSVDEVEETKDSGVVAGLGLVEVGEVLLEVGAQDSVDSKLATEGACISRHVEDGLGRVADMEGFMKSWLDNDLASSELNGLVARDRVLVVANLDIPLLTGALLLI